MNVLPANPGRLVVTGPGSPLAEHARAAGWVVEQFGSASGYDNACIVIASATDQVAELRESYPHALLLAELRSEDRVDRVDRVDDVDLTVPMDIDPERAAELLRHAEAHWRRCRHMKLLIGDVESQRRQMRQLSDIGLALSSQMKLRDLLATILTEARRIAVCEAGSLYLIEDLGTAKSLVFKLTQNDAIVVPFAEHHMPVTAESLAGYVATSGAELNIPDVYEISQEAPYTFNSSFDDQMGYRTRSALVLPMRDHRGRVIGVLQFLNKLDVKAAERRIIAFEDDVAELLRAVASQAAVSIQKNTLLNDISRLFESFVHASVRAIEKRDPSTSGHSFRVAESTVALLDTLPRSGYGRFKNLHISVEHRREVRYAALLHDFGKVSVREDILTKANKLSSDRLELIRHRVELAKERLRRRAVEKELAAAHDARTDLMAARRQIHQQLLRDIGVLDDYLEAVTNANRPTVLADGDFAHLQTIREFSFRELDGTIAGLISDADLVALSVRRGSLTPDERREIQSHVVHTAEFLNELPWPPELANVPAIAEAHHEKLDGSGYPKGLTASQIPLPSRVMTVCDIYDALTASDRPYKPAVSSDMALDILRDEAEMGLLDPDLVEIFIASEGYRSMAARVMVEMPQSAAHSHS